MYRQFNIFTILIIFCHQANENFASDNLQLYQSLAVIVKDKFLEDDRLLFIYINFNNSSKKELFIANDFMNEVLCDIDTVTYKILYQRKKKFHNLKHNEVILFDNLDSFRYFYQEFYEMGNINLSRTLMVILSLTTYDINIVSIVFKDLYHMGIIKVALIIQLASADIIMLTYFPFTPTTCHDFKPIIINHYMPDRQRWTHAEYFPTKLDNFYGCPLTCCAWINMPYFNIKNDTQNNSNIKYAGLEAKLLKFSAESMNFSIKIHIMDKTVPMEVYNEGSIFAKVFSETCDFALGGFSYRRDLDYKSAFSQTNYFYLSHIHLITNIRNVYTTYEKLVFPFHYIVWYTFGIILSITSLIIYMCGRRQQWKEYRHFLIGSTNKTPHFYLYALTVGGNMTTAEIPKRNFARFLLICWLLGALVLRSGYQSGMYQLLRHNLQRNLPRTIENVFEQNYLISMTPENRRYLPILPEVKRLLIFNSTIKETFPELLKFQESIAFITPYEHFGYFGKVNKTQWRHLHLVRERLLTQQLTIYVRHHSFLINELNDQIADAQYYGFIALWERQTLAESTNRKGLDSDNDNSNVLSMNELGSIFMILIWLNLISVIIFLIELVWHKYKNIIKSRIKC